MFSALLTELSDEQSKTAETENFTDELGSELVKTIAACLEKTVLVLSHHRSFFFFKMKMEKKSKIQKNKIIKELFLNMMQLGGHIYTCKEKCTMERKTEVTNRIGVFSQSRGFDSGGC